MRLNLIRSVITGCATAICLSAPGCRPYTPPPGAGGYSTPTPVEDSTHHARPASAVSRRGADSTRGSDQRALPVPNSYLRTNAVNVASRRRQEMVRKLKTITFNEIQFDEIPLGEVMRYLKEETRKRDPEGKGLNFMLFSPAANDGVNMTRGPGPATSRQGVVVQPTLDLENVIIDIDPPLRDLPLLYVLDAITRKADAPIQFAVTDYAVVAWPKTPGESDRFFRTFRGSPGIFQQGLEGVIGIPANGVGLTQ